MIWVLIIHMMTLLIWAAAAIYTPVLLLQRCAASASEDDDDGFIHTPRDIDSIARFVYTHIATPAAVISITAGSVVFLLNQSSHFWLVAKLTLVTLLCVAQAALGLLVIRVERGQFSWVAVSSRALLLIMLALMIAILWIVLGKPAEPSWFPG